MWRAELTLMVDKGNAQIITCRRNHPPDINRMRFGWNFDVEFAIEGRNGRSQNGRAGHQLVPLRTGESDRSLGAIQCSKSLGNGLLIAAKDIDREVAQLGNYVMRFGRSVDTNKDFRGTDRKAAHCSRSQTSPLVPRSGRDYRHTTGELAHRLLESGLHHTAISHLQLHHEPTTTSMKALCSDLNIAAGRLQHIIPIL
jgi:hypothetical protein